MSETGYLVLNTGELFKGVYHHGPDRVGEVVFNTGHAGYQEMATDPSYYRQILVMSAPMQGNYGADDAVNESKRIWIEGFICLTMQGTARENTWLEKLRQAGCPVLSEVDTRSLVVRLRELGTPWGALVAAKSDIQAKEKAHALLQGVNSTSHQDWVHDVTRKQAEDFLGENSRGPRVAVLDFGCKENILRELKKRCREIKVFPSRTSAATIREWNPDGVLLSNGPGDPENVQVARETVQELLGWRYIFGICMGHQILALALGAKTYKLKFGHRGGNHPIRDELLNRVYVTSQNHGYAVQRETLPSGVDVTHTNLNDGTVSGIRLESKRCFGVQFHPESHPGPHDAEGLFDYFISQIT